MLDKFLSTHTVLAFKNRRQIRLNGRTFALAESLAGKQIEPPARDLLTDSAPVRHHVMIYELVAEEEIAMESQDAYPIDRLLAEAVVFHQLIMKESDVEERTRSLDRSVRVLGFLLQDRLTRVFLEVHPDQLPRIRDIGKMWGMDREDWEKRVAGASAEAKAILELTNLPGVVVYKSNIWEDIRWGIDLFLVLEGTEAGMCVSIKTHVGDRTNVYTNEGQTPKGNGTRDHWLRIQEGTEEFNRRAERNWIPALIGIRKERGRTINTRHFAQVTPWAGQLLKFLQNRPQAQHRRSA